MISNIFTEGSGSISFSEILVVVTGADAVPPLGSLLSLPRGVEDRTKSSALMEFAVVLTGFKMLPRV